MGTPWLGTIPENTKLGKRPVLLNLVIFLE